MTRRSHPRRHRRINIVPCTASPVTRRDGAAQRAPTADQRHPQLSGRHEGCTLGPAPGMSSEKLRPCEVLDSPQASPWSLTWDPCGPPKELTPLKREGPPVKRSRPSPESDDLTLSSSSQPLVFRGGRPWRAPSTYGTCCVQQDKDGDKDRHALNMFCCQEEDTAEVVFRPKATISTPPPAPHTWSTLPTLAQPFDTSFCCDGILRGGTTTAPIVSFISKPLPHSLLSQVGHGVSHCHIDLIFVRVGHSEAYAKFYLNHRDTFPNCNNRCVANFCNTVTFKLRCWQPSTFTVAAPEPVAALSFCDAAVAAER